MKVSKKAGIALFVTTAVIMAVLIVFHKNLGPAADPGQELAKKIISCVVIAAACFAFIHWYDKFTGLPVELFQNRHLIWKLAKNDFKKRYAGSYLGAVWAMAQPVVTVAMYYIVFDKIMGNTSTPLREGVEVPFVLFLTAGLVPWFYFSEALNNGTNALLEYNYLVKYPAYHQDYCSHLYSCIFCVSAVDCGSNLRVLSYHIYDTDRIL